MSLKVRIVHWHGVAIWKWVVREEDCGICRQAFDSTCPSCLMPGDDCPPVWGKCNHHFHMHCIMKWTDQQSQRSQDHHRRTCPLCRQPWEIKLETIQPSNNQNHNNDNNDNNNNQLQQPQPLRSRPRRSLQFD